MTSRADDMRELSSQFAPSETDVLCAKGKQAKEHPGNRYLTTLIQSHLKEYSAATTKLDKSFVVSKIIKQVRGAGGLFVRNVKGQWYDIGNRKCLFYLQKISMPMTSLVLIPHSSLILLYHVIGNARKCKVVLCD